MQKMKANDDDTSEVEVEAFTLSDKWTLEDSELQMVPMLICSQCLIFKVMKPYLR